MGPTSHDAELHTVIRRPVLSTILLVCLLALPPALAGAQEQRPQREPTDRLAGATRVDTAAVVAERTFDTATTVTLAFRGDWPDALAGASLAGAVGGPVLLSGSDELPERTAEAMEHLATERVLILGGTRAISEQVAQDLRARGYEVERVSGQTRYGTAAEIARRIAEVTGTIDGQRAAFIATGTSFADALAAGPGSFHARIPVLLTRPGELPAETAQALDDIGAEQAIILGGTAAVSTTVQQQLEDRGLSTRRLAGRTRVDTAVRVAAFLAEELGIAPDELVLTTGEAFPDALAAAPHAGTINAPVLLVPSRDALDYDLLQFVVDHAERIEVVRAIGGTAAISQRVLERVAEAAVVPIRTLTYQIGVQSDEGEVASDVELFAEHVDWTLTDQRGWSLDNDYRWTRVGSEADADLVIWLASPGDVAEAAPTCDRRYSCTVGDEVYINDERWQRATDTYQDRPLEDYRHYVVIHEVGHWLELDHYECGDSADGRAPVMQQQSISLDGCESNVWPLPFELDQARENLARGEPSA